MPQTKAKPSKSQQVRGKSEIDDLFSRLLVLYQPGPFPPLSLPMFKDAKVPVLIFPTVQIAQARVWRNLGGPSSEGLKAAIDAASVSGMDREQVCFLMGLCEALFRPVRTVELALEKFFPDFLFSKHATWPPSRIACDLLAREFRQRWNDEKKILGDTWVLAAGNAPFPIRHRPAPIAPWMVGVMMKRWLMSLETEPEKATDLAVSITSVLLNGPIRIQELQHWEGLLDKILVATDHRKTPLPAYLISSMNRLRAPYSNTQIEQLTPARYLDLFPIDEKACIDLANMLSRAWTPPKEKKWHKPAPPKSSRGPSGIGEAVEPENDDLSTVSSDEEDSPEEIQCRPCELCRQNVSMSELLRHLEQVHSISRDMVEPDPERRELIHRQTKQVLFKW